MPYLTIGGDDFDPARDMPDDHAADPHPLAPDAETDSSHLWCEGLCLESRWTYDPEAGDVVHTLYLPPIGSPGWGRRTAATR